ncbi:hypothetical protein LGQ03_13695 [Loktanella sp. TSTF-M6]|uniref:Sulfotransferase family protein n=1 Tax=Loktanella gaetbuli TaxID=2881335 RepID=A0ABS8BXQ2_9RHOB|nr:hypothetical protein [Loktanella gaetbuli]MCB5200296.1 hypothetical protein [Loktanella gaetbuli]
MDVVAHIGIPKTGSSAIQSMLRSNRAALERQGVVYRNFSSQLSHAEFLVAAHHQVGVAIKDQGIRALFNLRGQDDYARVTHQLEADLDKVIADHPDKQLLISCEMLGWPMRGQKFIETFAKWLKARFTTVRVIVYLRAQDSWILSNYSQQLKNGSAERFDDYLARQKVPDYAVFLTRWERAVGADAVTVRLFDRARLRGGDLGQDFCAALGVTLPDTQEAPTRNATLSARGSRWMRRLNAVSGGLGNSRPGFAIMRVLRRGLIACDLGDGGRLRLTDAQRETLLAQTGPGNAAVRNRWFPQLDSLFATMPETVTP